MPKLTLKMLQRITVISLLLCVGGCDSFRCNAKSGDEGILQRVYGPAGIRFERATIHLDLDGDGHPERIVLLFRSDRGMDVDVDATKLIDGLIVDGFEVYNGAEPRVPVFYSYPAYDGYNLRYGRVEGQHVLVSDGGRDHTQRVWGWWRQAEHDWRADEWEAKERYWDDEVKAYGPWHEVRRVFVNQTK